MKRGFGQEMIPHQAQDVNLPIGLVTSLAQRLDEPIPIRVIPEDEFASLAAIQDVVNRPFSYSMPNGGGMVGSSQKPSACVNSED